MSKSKEARIAEIVNSVAPYIAAAPESRRYTRADAFLFNYLETRANHTGWSELVDQHDCDAGCVTVTELVFPDSPEDPESFLFVGVLIQVLNGYDEVLEECLFKRESVGGCRFTLEAEVAARLQKLFEVL